MKDFLILLLSCLTCCLVVKAQVIPIIPEAESPTPSASQSPPPTSSPSPSLSPSPSPIPLEASLEPSFGPEPFPVTEPDLEPDGEDTSQSSGALPVPVPSSEQDLPSPSTEAATDGSSVTGEEDGEPFPTKEEDPDECVRDLSEAKPVLGNSQLLSAFAVIGSAAAVAFASIFYGIAADWETEHEHEFLRLSCILMARILIIFAVKVSAALVAAITNAEPGEGALDASGAFLTWASAIFTRLYYEAFSMTLTAIGFFDKADSWDVELKEYLRPTYKRGDDQVLVGESSDEGNPDGYEEDEERAELTTGVQSLSLRQRLFGGRPDRILLLFNAVLYILAEVSTLSIAMIQLVDSLNRSSAIEFASPEEAGQCAISVGDAPAFVATAIVQAIYVLVQQQSLVPLLTIAASTPHGRRDLKARVVQIFRDAAGIILIIWVATLACLPLLQPLLLPFYITGDLSLFWYVVLAPPSYSSLNYQIALSYAIMTTIIGLLVLTRLRREIKRRSNLIHLEEREAEEQSKGTS